MLDHFCIVDSGGKVLFEHKVYPLQGVPTPVDALISNVLLEERTTKDQYTYNAYAMKWAIHTSLGFVCVCIWQKMLPINYGEVLLGSVKDAFADFIDPKGDLKKDEEKLALRIEEYSGDDAKDFGKLFLGILKEAESGLKSSSKAPRSFEESKKQKEDAKKGVRKEVKVQAKQEEIVQSTESAPSPISPLSDDLSVEEKRQQFIKKQRGQMRGYQPKKAKSGSGTPEKAPRKKESRTWDNDQSYSTSQMRKLDQSADASEADKVAAEEKLLESAREEFLGGDVSKLMVDLDVTKPAKDAGAAKETKTAEKKGWFSGFLKNLSVNKELGDDDLEPVIAKFRTKLMEKNVAADIAEKLCASVSESLRGRIHNSFHSLQTTVYETLEDSLTRILTPKRNIDILRDIMKKKEAGTTPYVITFCGVNGVGKSTNLAKTAFWLMQNNMKVMIAACDTFRSGAVEQLRVHSRCLDVPVYERGYGKDAAGIAADAIKSAKSQGIDVVLVDTAGRMQDNEPLMRALAKLVSVNQPDLVLFVGEALVGNDAVDQLSKFNQALIDLAEGDEVRPIDGIILTKFDTVDEKVGAALSMVYTTGQPIVFVGTGQKYTDLRKFNVKTVTQFLLN